MRTAARVALALAVATSGCSSLSKPPETGPQTGLGRIAIVAASDPPEVRFDGFPKNSAEATATTALGGFASCAALFGGPPFSNCGNAARDPVCGAIAIAVIALCGTVGVAVTAATSEERASADQNQAAHDTLMGAAQSASVQARMRDRLAAQAADHGTALAGEAAADTILEVAITRAGTRGALWPPEAPLHLYMDARVRLLRASDRAPMLQTEYSYDGPSLTLSAWTAGDAKRLVRELEQGHEALAAQIYDDTFLLYPFPYRRAYRAGRLADTFGLAPESPRVAARYGSDEPLWLEADSLRPTFRWQAFPRKGDLERAPDDMSRVRNVRYDLLVAEAGSRAIVYRRSGLASAQHTLEQPLAPGRRYLWTVRARFELDGRERVTEWGSMYPRASAVRRAVSSMYAGGTRPAAPTRESYRFSTPPLYIEREDREPPSADAGPTLPSARPTPPPPARAK